MIFYEVLCYLADSGLPFVRISSAYPKAELFSDAGLEDTAIHSGFKEIVDALNKPSDAYQLNTANRLYSQIDYEVLDTFLKTLTIQYQSDIKSVDFVKNGENTRQEINHWVEEITRGKIKDLIAPGILDALTRLVIVNAIYFKGDWKHKFKEAATIKKPFYSAPNKETKVTEK